MMVRPGPILPCAFLVLGLTMATAPTWGFFLFGFNPTLDQLLAVICRQP